MDATFYFDGEIYRPVDAVCSNCHFLYTLILADVENANRRGFVLSAMMVKNICRINSFHIS